MSTHIRVWLIVVVVGAMVADCIAQDEQKGPRASTNGSAWRGFGDSWTRTSTYELSGYAERPEEGVVQSVNVRWAEPEIDALGNYCTLRGQLWIPNEVAGKARPIDWFQGVTVYVAFSSGSQPDWSKGTSEKDAYEKTAVVGGSGRFDVTFDLRKLERDHKRSQPFQFGLSLAEHTEMKNGQQQVVWMSKTPVIAAATTMLKIPAPVLSPELELINEAASWPFSNPDGTKLIRAANALRKLGKDDALTALENYIELNDGSGRDYEEIVFWIIRVLFEPIRLEGRIPPPYIGVFFLERGDADAPLWPLEPIDLVDDIPFMMGRLGSASLPELPYSHIEWARRHCVIRDEPLRPTSNPLVAAKKLLGSRKFSRLNEYATNGATRIIKSQAVTMVAGILEPLPERRRNAAKAQEDWEARIKTAEELGIAWSEKEERFIVTRPPKLDAR